MNTAMWDHPLTAQQLRTVRGFGWLIIDPVSKQLACGDVGFGAMEAPAAIADAVGRSAHEYLMQPQPFSGTGPPQVGPQQTSCIHPSQLLPVDKLAWSVIEHSMKV